MLSTIVGVILLVVIALVLFRIGLATWHFFRGDVELEPAGSWGWQTLRRSKDKRPEDLL